MSHGIVTIDRWSHGPMGTFGDLLIGAGADERRCCYTLELPWDNNQRSISCIPRGVYPLRRDRYHAGDYDCWEICDVQGRDEIKIHIGNTIQDIQGCVVLGKKLGWIDKWWAVTESGTAFRAFMAEMEQYEDATIIVTENGGKR